jgi:hypothetical protein
MVLRDYDSPEHLPRRPLNENTPGGQPGVIRRVVVLVRVTVVVVPVLVSRFLDHRRLGCVGLQPYAL